MSMLEDLNTSWDMGNYVPNDGNNNGLGVVTTGVMDNATVSTGPDTYSGLWQAIGGAIGNIAQYSIAKDAAKSGLVTGRTPNGQPIYAPANTMQQPMRITGGISANALILIGAAVFAVMTMKKG